MQRVRCRSECVDIVLLKGIDAHRVTLCVEAMSQIIAPMSRPRAIQVEEGSAQIRVTFHHLVGDRPSAIRVEDGRE